MLTQHLYLALLAFLFQPTRTQPTACTYSCPLVDELGQVLLKSVLATPYESFYSNFECVYVPLAYGVFIATDIPLAIVK